MGKLVFGMNQSLDGYVDHMATEAAAHETTRGIIVTYVPGLICYSCTRLFSPLIRSATCLVTSWFPALSSL
jgi:hypothetical protein